MEQLKEIDHQHHLRCDRIREEFVRTGDSHQSVVNGLASMARVITSAALIMVSVFAAFLLTPDAEVKMFAIGLSVAIVVDAWPALPTASVKTTKN